MPITSENVEQIRDILSAQLTPTPDYRSISYAEMCEPYRFRYYSYHRPPGSWMRVGQEMLTVDEKGGLGHGFVYTKQPIEPEILISLELYPVSSSAWDHLSNLVAAYAQSQ
jgi:hypothetical protein